MMNNKPDNNLPKIHRREVIIGGIAAIASMLVAFNPFKSSEKKPEKIKMLAEDGTLVEVDASMLTAKNKKKITNKELQEWIKEK